MTQGFKGDANQTSNAETLESVTRLPGNAFVRMTGAAIQMSSVMQQGVAKCKQVAFPMMIAFKMVPAARINFVT